MTDDLRAGSMKTDTLTANVGSIETLAALGDLTADTLVLDDGTHRVAVTGADGGVRVEVCECDDE